MRIIELSPLQRARNCLKVMHHGLASVADATSQAKVQFQMLAQAIDVESMEVEETHISKIAISQGVPDEHAT